MNIRVDSTENIEITDSEIVDILNLVYVQAGYTSEEVARVVFDPVAVRNRGTLFAAREQENDRLAGMVIVVPPESQAIVRAGTNECEMHLLGVNPSFRGRGIGKSLVESSINYAIENDWTKMILWTQRPMVAAQRLYEAFGFSQTDEMNRNGIDFLVYERSLT